MARASRSRLSPGHVLVAIAALALAAWSLAPAVWQLLTALKSDAQITRFPTVYLPQPIVFDHVRELWERKPFATYLANSALIATAATLLALAAALPAAASLTRLRGRRRDAILLALLGAALFPPVLLLYPLYEGVRALGWINQPQALILPYAALNVPLAVWVLETAFRALPPELDEAGRLDGLGAYGRLWHIHAPLVAPSIVTAGILVFVFAWNEFMLALTFMTRDSAKTVTAGIASVGGASLYEIPWGQLAAAVMLATAPLVLLVFVFQRRIVSGLTRGGVKG